MEIKTCCGYCGVRLKRNELLVRDKFSILRHERCYDFKNYGHFVDAIGEYESVKGLSRHMLNAYKTVFSMNDKQCRRPEDIPDDEVYAALYSVLGYPDD